MAVRTADGLDVVLDEEHWQEHIIKRHPELEPYQGLVVETLTHPERIFRSRRDPTTRIYTRTCTNILIGDVLIERTSLLVYVREDSVFVVTAHFATAMWRSLGEKIWPL